MRVGEAAARAGVNIETFRYYERRGLLPKPDRAPSGHRSYDDETVRFVRAIKEAQGLGFTLAEIEEFLRVRGPADEALRIRLAAKIDEVDAKIASLRRVRESLAQVVGCACTSLDHCTCGAAYLARRGRTTPAATLHVTNGESAANTLRQTGLGGSVLAWDDALHEGPVPLVPPAELRRIRARFLAEAGWGTTPAIRAELERRDELLLEAESLVLWFEHDLYDQLQLIQVLSMIERADLIDAGTFLGPLSADELEALWPRRARVSDEQLTLARAAWDAFRAPDPTGLELLEALVDGPRRPHDLFLASQAREEAAFDGDAWVWRRLAALAPLIAPLGGGRVPTPPPGGDGRVFAATGFELSDQGRAVLAGRADRVDSGLDRWLGGTHLTPENDWRWDGIGVSRL